MSVKIVRKLSAWYSKNHRHLPWRVRPDAYRTWLSETMLQQTQVKTVIPYFEKFLEHFPTIQDLANAREEEVMKLWAGLGYYSRARNLHRGAKQLSDWINEQGRFPETRADWLKIPGVGEYTAGAILSIVWNRPEAIVDGNVVRIISRIQAISDPGKNRESIWKVSKRWVNLPGVIPREFNQAMMELGATVCRPKNPDCPKCPVQSECLGKSHPLDFPKKLAKKAFVSVHEKCVVLVSQNQVLLAQNQKGEWREGLWDFPKVLPAAQIKKANWVSEFSLKYVVTHHRVLRDHHVFLISKPTALRQENLKWFALQELPGVPAPVKKALTRIKTP